jgi:hypothetical protein
MSSRSTITSFVLPKSVPLSFQIQQVYHHSIHHRHRAKGLGENRQWAVLKFVELFHKRHVG